MQIKMESVDYFRPGQQLPVCKLLAQASTQESIPQLLYKLRLEGLQKPESVVIHLPIQATTNTQGMLP